MNADRRALPISAAWSGVVLLVLIGVAAGIGRAAFVSDLGTRIEPFRERTLHSLGRTDRFVHREPEEMLEFDRKFRIHPVVAYLHVIPGAIFLAFAPFQLSTRIRTRHPRLHRRMGRVLMICALISAMSALFFGLFMPYAGWNEAILIALVGAALLVAVSRGYIAIRRGFVDAHREWMLRSFAIGLGISTARVFALALDLPGIDATPREIFVISIWSGWIFTLAVTEIWIRVTRAAPLLRGARA